MIYSPRKDYLIYYRRPKIREREGKCSLHFAVPDKLLLSLLVQVPTDEMPAGEELGPFLHLEDQPFAVASNLDLGAFYKRWLRHDDLTLRVHFWQDLERAAHVVRGIVVLVAGAHTVKAQEVALIVHQHELAGTLVLPPHRALVVPHLVCATFHERRDRAVSDAAHGYLNAEGSKMVKRAVTSTIVQQDLGRCIVWSDDWDKATVEI